MGWQPAGPTGNGGEASQGAVVPCPTRATPFDQANGGAAHQVERRAGPGGGLAGWRAEGAARAGAARRGGIDLAADVPGSY
jgi:hypothetical protein